MDIFLH